MEKKHFELLKAKCGQKNFTKLVQLNNPEVIHFIAKYAEICNPSSVFIRDDSLEDARYIRNRVKELGEESPLLMDGHTVHFDGYFDQARDKENTRFLITKDLDLGPDINSIDREEGLREIHGILKDIMQEKEMFVLFLCLGPVNSDFSIYAMQITDSAYVAHSEDILYRPTYENFKNNPDLEFFKYVHSAGELNQHLTSKNTDQRRIYVDFSENIVFSTNTQYGGNTIGLKKLSLRLAIRKADKEGWLAEHMFVMGVHGANHRKTYFAGAFPFAHPNETTKRLSMYLEINLKRKILRNKTPLKDISVSDSSFGQIACD